MQGEPVGALGSDWPQVIVGLSLTTLVLLQPIWAEYATAPKATNQYSAHLHRLIVVPASLSS
jgi:hypothetical protein